MVHYDLSRPGRPRRRFVLPLSDAKDSVVKCPTALKKLLMHILWTGPSVALPPARFIIFSFSAY